MNARTTDLLLMCQSLPKTGKKVFLLPPLLLIPRLTRQIKGLWLDFTLQSRNPSELEGIRFTAIQVNLSPEIHSNRNLQLQKQEIKQVL